MVLFKKEVMPRTFAAAQKGLLLEINFQNLRIQTGRRTDVSGPVMTHPNKSSNGRIRNSKNGRSRNSKFRADLQRGAIVVDPDA